jgi:hypothetical protein
MTSYVTGLLISSKKLDFSWNNFLHGHTSRHLLVKLQNMNLEGPMYSTNSFHNAPQNSCVFHI